MDIVRHEPCILPGVTLGEVIEAVHGVERVERRAEMTLAVHAPHEIHSFVEVTAVALTAVEEIVVIVGLAEFLRHLSRAPVGECIFETLGNGLVGRVFVVRDITILAELLQAALIEQH